MKIATNEIEHLREEVKNCHRIIKDLQNKREFVGLTDQETKLFWTEHGYRSAMCKPFAQAIEAKLKEKNGG